MTLRLSATVFVLLGLGAVTAHAQPVAPVTRPAYSSYWGTLNRGGAGFYPGYGGYGGYGGGGGFGAGGGAMQIQQQNIAIQQQLNMTNQLLANLQSTMAYGINPNLPLTGRGAVFNNLGHWYPSAPGGGGGGGGGYGGGMGRGMGGGMLGGTSGTGMRPPSGTIRSAPGGSGGAPIR